MGQARPKVWGVIENYHISMTGENGARNRLTWVEATAEASPLWSATTSYLEAPFGRGMRRTLDESYIRYTSPQIGIRAGRIRSPFGFNNWSDYFYTPIIIGPLLRSMKLTPTIGIRRPDTGVEISGGSQVQYQVAFVDVANDEWRVVPNDADTLVARVQTAVAGAVVGMSAQTRLGGGSEGTQIAGLDLRWTFPRFIVRGEYARAIGEGPGASGYSAEVFYRPPNLAKTQVGFRTEMFDPISGADLRLHQLGVRQVLTPNFAATLNYGWSNRVGRTRDLQGWSIQLMSSMRF